MTEEWWPTLDQAPLVEQAEDAQRQLEAARQAVDDARAALARARQAEDEALTVRDRALRSLMDAGVTAYRAALLVGISESAAGRIRARG